MSVKESIERLREAPVCKNPYRATTVAVAVEKSDLAALLELVDRLPKTADGVPITPGMMVWHCTEHSWKSKGSHEFAQMVEGIGVKMPRPYCVGRRCWDDGCQGDSGGGTTRDWSECYSTREAASAGEVKRG